MKTKLKSQFTKGLVLVFTLVLVSFFVAPQQAAKPWVIPAKYKTMKNTMAGDKASISVGKSIFAKHCASCHGKKGLGDGTKAASLKTYPGDFSSDEFKAQKDGEMYYKSFVGRDEMPNFEKKILDDEDRWSLINFMRSL